MTLEEVYRQLNFHHNLTDDDKQELAIKIWQALDQYSSEYSFRAWVTKIVKNYEIDKSRRKATKENSLTIPLSFFERTNDDLHVDNPVSDLLASDELSPEEQLIYLQAQESALTEAKNCLSEKEKVFVDKILTSDRWVMNSNERSTFKRILQKIKNKQKKKKYILTNVDGSMFEVETIKQAASIIGCTTQLVDQALKSGRLFYNKKWKIS